MSAARPDATADPRPVEPVSGPIDATVRVPGSKSITNRALVCAALARGTSWLTGALVADDTEAMMGCLRHLGADVDVDPAGGEAGATIEVVGVGGRLAEGPLDLDVRLSGTTARFLLPVLGIGGGPYRLDGDPPLRARPMAPVLHALRGLGVDVDLHGEPGHLPVVVHGGVTGSAAEVDRSLSSQFVSGLLLAGPCYHAGLTLDVVGEEVSAPYVALTLDVMRAFGAAPESDGVGRYRVPKGGYTAVAPYAIEPDATSASYAFAAAVVAGGRVRVDGLGRASRQGDLAFVDLLERMGAQVERSDDHVEVRSSGQLRGIDADLRDIPDVAQTLAAVAVFAEGPTRVRGVGIIRGHETDRVAAVVAELRRCGIDATETDDGFVVEPGGAHGADVQTYDDHRMAMSFALIGLRVPGIRIGDPGCVAKTFPSYWDLLDSLGSRAR